MPAMSSIGLNWRCHDTQLLGWQAPLQSRFVVKTVDDHQIERVESPIQSHDDPKPVYQYV